MKLVTDIMRTDLVTVRPDTPIAELLHLMKQHQISGIPVVDEQGDLQGVVTTADLVRKLPYDTGADAPEGFWLDIDLMRVKLSEDAPEVVADVMSRTCYHVGEFTSLLQVAQLMSVKRIHRLVVTRDQRRVIGIVTSLDLVEYLGELLQG